MAQSLLKNLEIGWFFVLFFHTKGYTHTTAFAIFPTLQVNRKQFKILLSNFRVSVGKS